jgi:predicted dienelactone hydrolase
VGRKSVLALCLVACGGELGEEGPSTCASTELPVFAQESTTGIRQFQADYALPWDGTQRELDMHLWYPSDDTTGNEAEYLGFLEDPNSLVDASYAELESTCLHPLVVYSHGSQAWAGSGSTLLRQFVQAGWVAIAPDHLGNTLNDNWDPRPKTFSLTRVLDVQFAIDYLESLPEEDPLAGRVDTSRVLVVGHSFGGQTAWLSGGPSFDAEAIAADCDGACTEAELAAYAENPGDPRVAAVVPMAGNVPENLVAADGFGDVSVPVLYLTGSEDFDGLPHFDRAAAVEDLTWAEIEGGCHETFTDTTLACDVDKAEGLAIVTAFAAAQGWRSVLDSEVGAGILEGSEVVSPLVTVTR